MIGLAFFALMLFSSFEIGYKPVINRLATGSLMVYLTHEYLFPVFNIPYYSSLGGGAIVISLLITVVVCYMAGWLISVVYGFLMKPLTRKITSLLKNVKISA